VKNKRPPTNPQPPQNFRRELENVQRDLTKLGAKFKPSSLRLPEGFKPAELPDHVKQTLAPIAKAARERWERQLEHEQNIEREQQEHARAKQRPLKRGGRPEKITVEMQQEACTELENWVRGHDSEPSEEKARKYMRDWLAEEPRKIVISDSTIYNRIVYPTYRRLRNR
jgi:hypothetical protein